MKAATYIALILLLASCGPGKLLGELTKDADAPTKKEMRRAKRSAKKLTKLTAKYPEMLQSRQDMVPVSITTPQISGTIYQPYPQPYYILNSITAE